MASLPEPDELSVMRFRKMSPDQFKAEIAQLRVKMTTIEKAIETETGNPKTIHAELKYLHTVIFAAAKVALENFRHG